MNNGISFNGASPLKPNQGTSAHNQPKKNIEGIFIYRRQTLPLRQILKPQLF
jgi:hypothetical protein